MNIAINDQRKISEIRDQFHAMFPYLKLEFFTRPHEIADFSKKKYLVDHDVSVAECRAVHNDGEVVATGEEKVWQLEQDFQRFGLPAQVFRLMGNNWIETVQTDWWTLNEQNEEGREFSTAYNASEKYKNEEPDLYNL